MDMDNEDTQPATQPFEVGERVDRNNSGLTEKDLADVICILHPASNAAVRNVEHLARTNPQHILQNGDLLGPASPPDLLGSRDIALRLSAKVIDRPMGFKFGRTAKFCDVVLGNGDREKRVSQTHFRIFLTEHDILMIQDMSVNGTLVDEVLLLSNSRTYDHSRTLLNGTVVTLGLLKDGEEQIKFIVRIPLRYGFEDMYEDNLQRYHQLISDEVERRKAPKAQDVIPTAVSIARAWKAVYLG